MIEKSKVEAKASYVDDILGSVSATPRERIDQALQSKQEEFFMRIAPQNILLKIEGNLTREKVLGGEAVTVSPTWEMTLEEAHDYLVAQKGEINFFRNAIGLMEDKEKPFTAAWKEMEAEKPYKTLGHKGLYYTYDAKNAPIEEYFMYVVVNAYVKRSGEFVFNPNYILITKLELTPQGVVEHVEKIVAERKEYANTQNSLDAI